MTDVIPESPRFANLFKGLDRAYGTGEGRWVHEPPRLAQYAQHLRGEGPGLGIAPLLDNGRCHFGVIDLDEPDFDAAKDMADLLPGPTFIERSRSGNAHVWVFFADPDGVEAWVVRGILRMATAACGLPRVEVFPKQDKLRAGMVGSYINLPYFGDTRPILKGLRTAGIGSKRTMTWQQYGLGQFLAEVELAGLNDAETWRKRAHYLKVPSPESRAQREGVPFGEQPYLHMCAEHVIANRETTPTAVGHRSVVFFNLSKQLSNCSMFDTDEALELLTLVNDASPDPIPDSELRRIYFNAERGEFTSTGCDDPLFAPYAHPDCPIARS